MLQFMGSQRVGHDWAIELNSGPCDQLVSFLWLWFSFYLPYDCKDKSLIEASWWERLTEREHWVFLMGGVMLSKSFIQFSIAVLGCVPSMLFYLRPNYGGSNEDNGIQFSQFSGSVLSDSLWPHGLQHARLPCPSPTPRACSSSCPLSEWCHPTISSSVVPWPWLKSESNSVVSSSLQPKDYTVHKIPQVRILEWVAFPFSRWSSQPREWTQVSHIADRLFTSWPTREAQEY